MILLTQRVGTFPFAGLEDKGNGEFGMSATINDIAQRAQTSKSTVSRYLTGGSISKGVAARIQEAIDILGYRPNVNARRLVQSRSGAIGIVFDDISNYIYGDMMAGVQESAILHGYSCIFFSRGVTKMEEKDYLPLFSSATVDAVIYVSFEKRLSHEVQELGQSGLPILLIGDSAGVDSIPTVDVDNEGGTIQEVSYLIKKGHRRIAYLEGPGNMPAAVARRNGYLAALKQAGIPLEENLICKTAWSYQDAYRNVTEMIKREEFTALVGSNAYSTYGGMQALLDNGLKIPTDVVVAGFDDAPICEYAKPAITTLAQPLRQMGVLAVEKVIQCIKQECNGNGTSYLMPVLIVRKST